MLYIASRKDTTLSGAALRAYDNAFQPILVDGAVYANDVTFRKRGVFILSPCERVFGAYQRMRTDLYGHIEFI